MLLLLLLSCAGFAQAQNVALSFDPPAPAAQQPFTLVVQPLDNQGPWLGIQEVTVQGRRITILVQQQLIPQIFPQTYRFPVNGLPDGSYTVDIYRRPISVMSPPNLRNLIGTLQLTVGRGSVDNPIPAGNPWTWLALGTGLVALAFSQRRRLVAFAATRRPR
jgi:hypothetical protein